MVTQSRLIAMTDAERTTALAGPPEEVARLLLEAAEAGHAEAQLLTGQICLDGNGVARDAAEALRWFGLAAKAGNPMAMNMIGRCCEHGWGTVIDKALAAQWYRSAADRGLAWGMYNLATLYTLGEGVSEHKAQALNLFERAAALEHAKSINMIGSFYEDGWVVERNLVTAASHYRKAAEGGDFRGQFNHARMLAEAGDLDHARRWLSKMTETATPAFREKARMWMTQQTSPIWHDDLIRAVD